MINHLVKLRMGIYSSTFIHRQFCKSSFILISIFLDYCQRLYTYWLLSLSNLHLTKEIISINLREKNKEFQLEKTLENIFIWIKNAWPILYWQWLVYFR